MIDGSLLMCFSCLADLSALTVVTSGGLIRFLADSSLARDQSTGFWRRSKNVASKERWSYRSDKTVNESNRFQTDKVLPRGVSPPYRLAAPNCGLPHYYSVTSPDQTALSPFLFSHTSIFNLPSFLHSFPTTPSLPFPISSPFSLQSFPVCFLKLNMVVATIKYDPLLDPPPSPPPCRGRPLLLFIAG